MKEFIRSRITDAGRVVIPAELRREYGLDDGQEVVFCRGETGLELLTVPQALKRAQDAIRKYIPGDDVDLTDEVLAARKRDGSLR
jgi:AbrB family transcriptional regulator (stage V sporulation protein T)